MKYFGEQNTDFLDGIFDSRYIYIIPQPVKDAWHNYVLYKRRQNFPQMRRQLIDTYTNYLARDIYVGEYNFYKMTLDIINKTFPPTIRLTRIRHPGVADILEGEYMKIINIVETNRVETLNKLIKLFKN